MMLLSKQAHAVFWERRGMRQGNMARHVIIQARPCGVSGKASWHVVLLVKGMRWARQQGTWHAARQHGKLGKARDKATRHVARQQGKRQGNMASRAKPAEASNPL